MFGVTSAAPADLTAYVDAAGDGTARLTTVAGQLRTALDAFRASEGRAAFLADVPEADLALSFLARRWARLAGWLGEVARAFDAADGGEGVAVLADDVLADVVPPVPLGEAEVIRRRGRVVVDTGVGGDLVLVSVHDGIVVVVVNGVPYRFAAGTGDGVVIRAGAGNDSVLSATAAWSPAGLALDGGTGADHLAAGDAGAVLRGGAGDDLLVGGRGADRLLGGAGADRLVGGAGADRLLAGAGRDVVDGDAGDDQVVAGAGEDLVYGGDGDDRIDGGAGRDHVDGGAGADHLAAGARADIVSGGEGHDTITGGPGDDVVLAGPGRDLVDGGGGVDRTHVEGDDVVVGTEPLETVLDLDVDLALLDAVLVHPPDGAFAARVRSDLVTLASTATGAALLASLQGHPIHVVADMGVGSPHTDAYHPASDTVQYSLHDDDAGFGAMTATDRRTGPSYSPAVALLHELVHAAHDVTGTQVPGDYRGPDRQQLDRDRDGRVTGRDAPVANEERATVGLPIDHDEDPSTPDVPAEEVWPGQHITENDLRHELGLPVRERY